MPELNFEITGVEAATAGLSPLLNFQLRITNTPPSETIQAVLLRAQIQILSPARCYTPQEKEKLRELFGQAADWGRTLRNRLWMHTQATVGEFAGGVSTLLAVPCSYDLNLAITKYFYALEEGTVAVLFLFSGSVFFATEGRLLVQQIPWSKECTYRLPVQVWRQLMESHYPNSAWLYLNREVFERLYAYKRQHGLVSWEQTIERLLPAVHEVAA